MRFRCGTITVRWERLIDLSMGLSNQEWSPILRRMKLIISVYVAFMVAVAQAFAAEPSILMLGDSLTAGYGLEPSEALPLKLEQTLRAEGVAVTIVNAGVSGDTMAQGQLRLDWALNPDIDAVIVALGGNDALRGLPPTQTREHLALILAALKLKNLPVLVLGMRAPPNLGPEYVRQFEAIYPELAAQYEAQLYPFMLEGVAGDAALNQADGIHPNIPGVAVLVPKISPAIKLLLQKLSAPN